jgi:hypothetical protein
MNCNDISIENYLPDVTGFLCAGPALLFFSNLRFQNAHSAFFQAYYQLSFNGDRRNYAKVHCVVLSGENKNNAYHLLQDLKQIDRSLLAAYEFARARKIGKFRRKRLRHCDRYGNYIFLPYSKN